MTNGGDTCSATPRSSLVMTPRSRAAVTIRGPRPGSASLAPAASSMPAEQPDASAHVADQVVPGQRPERGGNRRLELAHPGDQLLALHDVQVGKTDRTRGRVSGVRVTVAEDLG